jgi:AraC family transcriptional regulator
MTAHPPTLTIVTFPLRWFGGLVRRYTRDTRADIPAQWRAFAQAGGPFKGPVYGISFNADPAKGTFDYLTGEECSQGATDPKLGVVGIEGPYACLASKAHISAMPDLFDSVYRDGLQDRSVSVRPGPAVEYYPATFDAKTGLGGFEIWVPVTP